MHGPAVVSPSVVSEGVVVVGGAVGSLVESGSTVGSDIVWVVGPALVDVGLTVSEPLLASVSVSSTLLGSKQAVRDNPRQVDETKFLACIVVPPRSE